MKRQKVNKQILAAIAIILVLAITTTATYLVFFQNKCTANTDCDDLELSTTDSCIGSPRKCENKQITACRNNDNYCPSGCDMKEDKDCLCKTNQECDDGLNKTRDECTGNPKACLHSKITECIQGDYYCPPGCVYQSDNDCDPNHKCSANSDCNDLKDSTSDFCAGFPRDCTHQEIIECKNSDGYCPSSCKPQTDDDCTDFFDKTQYDVNVIVLKYFPTLENGNLDISQTGDWQNPDKSALQAHVNTLTEQTVYSLTQASRYKGYKNPDAKPFLNYKIIIDKEFPRQIKASTQYPPFPDHISELNDIEICNYVENKNVKQVWIWMVHNAKLVPIESNMAGPYGDISNSNRQPDMPVCKKTYTVFDYNYGRGLGEALEDHGHQIEAIFNNADRTLFWDRFVQPTGDALPAINSCGWSHSPPNTKADYDWYNLAQMLSNCEDWTPLGGPSKLIDCRTWSNSSDCHSTNPYKDGNSGWKIYWMQNMPGYGNELTYEGKKIRNWWELVADYDLAMEKSKTLTE